MLLFTNRKFVIAFQDLGVHFTCDATWRKKRRFVTSGSEQNREKSIITEKRYEMERKLLLITNRKSVIAVQNPGLYLACDATWWKKTVFLHFRSITKSWKITYISETVRDGTKFGDCISGTGIIFCMWRHLAEKTAFRHFRFTTKSWKIANNSETVRDETKATIYLA